MDWWSIIHADGIRCKAGDCSRLHSFGVFHISPEISPFLTTSTALEMTTPASFPFGRAPSGMDHVVSNRAKFIPTTMGGLAILVMVLGFPRMRYGQIAI